MDKNVFFALEGNEEIAGNLAKKAGGEIGKLTVHQFPDKETLVQIHTDVKDRKVILVCTLHKPDDKIMALYFLAKTIKDLGAKHITLVAPYLSYMRQDVRFNEGEGITATYFAEFLSSFLDNIITIDPHLHRNKTLSAIYSIENKVLHATGLITDWIGNNIDNPVLVGPDSESEQWVKEVASKIPAPYLILEKTRKGDRDVSVSIPHVEQYKECTPIIIDDIISTARTMIETVKRLNAQGMKPVICIGVHGVFSSDAYEQLLASGVHSIITSNSIPHTSNRIDISDLIHNGLS